ncbi:MAG: nitrilase family protein [Kiritimatiellae bacterium]|nr:nitrilase family protein [Kiritimatiellia bacterium]
MNALKIAAVQFRHAPGRIAANLTKIEGFVRRASEQGVALVAFPEMCLPGYWHLRRLDRAGIAALAERVPDGPSCARLLELAAANGMTIGAGLIERSAEGRFYNAYFVALPDGRHACHRKLHAFISEHVDSGDAFTAVELPQGWKVGVLICYDNNIIENVRATALLDVDLILAPHQTGGCASKDPHTMGRVDFALWEQRRRNPAAIEAELKGPKGREWLLRWLPARAHDNGVFYCFSNGIGVDDDEIRTGNAMILDPYGRILAETWRADDDIVTATLDPELLVNSTGRRWVRTRRPELYGSLARRTGKEEDTRAVRFDAVGV